MERWRPAVICVAAVWGTIAVSAAIGAAADPDHVTPAELSVVPPASTTVEYRLSTSVLDYGWDAMTSDEQVEACAEFDAGALRDLAPRDLDLEDSGLDPVAARDFVVGHCAKIVADLAG